MRDAPREDGRGRVTGDELDTGWGGAGTRGSKGNMSKSAWDSEAGGISFGIGIPMAAGGQGRDLRQL